MDANWAERLSADLQRRREQHLFRERRVVRSLDSTHVEINGRTLINFSSNNYLGLTHHPRIVQRIAEAAAVDGFGAGAAPLISGYSPAHASAERAIAEWKGCESALLLPSGYQANLAAIQSAAAVGELQEGGVRFLVDKLAHASLIDAVRGSGQAFRVFPHNHMPKLERLLVDAPASQLQVVVTESIFSMDGDAADLPALATLKRKHPFLLILDEAHATGVYGPGGSGLAAEVGVGHLADMMVFTISKAMGGIGGAICGSRVLCEAAINFARAYLFSTAVPTAVARAAETAIEIMRDEPERQARVRVLARQVRGDLLAAGVAVTAGDSPIIPIIIGGDRAAMEAAARLLEEGMLVAAVRPPTVPRGTSRLRVTLCSDHANAQIAHLVATLTKICAAQPPQSQA